MLQKYIQSLLLIGLLCLGINITAYAQETIPPSNIQSTSLSVEQLQQAAQAGDPDAQYALGYMYYYGKNVPQNTQTGMNWIKRASVQGQEQATKALSILGQGGGGTLPVQATTASSTQANNATDDAVNMASNVSTADVTAAPTTSAATPISTTAASLPAAPTTKSPPPPFLKGGERLLTAANSAYTIQLLGSSNKNDLMQYVQANALDSQAMCYQTKHNNQSWYVLVYGIYANRPQAQAALLKLPASVRAQKPWIKSVGKVKEQMRG